MSRIDASGRLTSQAVSHVLDWQAGGRLMLTADSGVVVVRRDPHGMVTVPARYSVAIPTPSDIRQLMTWVKTHVVARRNARGGRSAQEHLVASLRCLYRRAVEDGLTAEADDPACSGTRRRLDPGAWIRASASAWVRAGLSAGGYGSAALVSPPRSATHAREADGG